MSALRSRGSRAYPHVVYTLGTALDTTLPLLAEEGAGILYQEALRDRRRLVLKLKLHVEFDGLPRKDTMARRIGFIAGIQLD